MTQTTTQGERAHALTAASHALDAHAHAVEAATAPALLDWRPSEGGWSIAQVFEHLCTANEDYLVAIRDALDGHAAGVRGSFATRLWRPSLAGRLLVKSFEAPRKLRAPRMWRPASAARPNVVGEFLARQRRLEELIDRSTAYDWQRVRLASPVSSLIRMNIGDAFTILVTHAERHFRQIERIRAGYEASRTPPVAALGR
jgi:hypothetical protein